MIVPDEEALLTRCYVCFSAHGKAGRIFPLLECKQCHLVRYCSTICQDKDEQAHKIECLALQRFSGGNPTRTYDPGSPIRRLARLYWAREGQTSQQWSRFDSLLGHERHDPMEVEDTTQVVLLARDLIKLSQTEVPSIEVLRSMHLKTIANSFTAADTNTGTQFGSLVDSTAALMNHSCSPNVNITYPFGFGVDKPLQVINFRPLTNGDELVYSYVPPALRYSTRQEELYAGWSFRCQCKVCQKTQTNRCPCTTCAGLESGRQWKPWIDPREALWCGRSECQGWMFMCTKSREPVGVCSKCKQPSLIAAGTIPTTLDDGKKLLEALGPLDSPDDFRQIQEMSAPILKRLTAIQPPCSYPLYELLQMVDLSLQMPSKDPNRRLEMLEEAMCFKILQISAIQAGGKSRMLPEGHVHEGQLLSWLGEDYYNYHLFNLKHPLVTSQAKPKTASRFLSRVPPLPPAKERLRIGFLTLMQAHDKLKGAFGVENENSRPLVKLKALMQAYQSLISR